MKTLYNSDSIMDANSYYLELVSDCSHTLEQLQGRRRDALIVNEREYIAVSMRKANFSIGVIAHVMNRDSSSVKNLLNRSEKNKL